MEYAVLNTCFVIADDLLPTAPEFLGDTPRVPDEYRDMIAWNAEQIALFERIIAHWPLTLIAETQSFNDVLFCHATPRDENEIFTRLTPEDRLASVFGSLDVAMVVCGHTHMQFDRIICGVRVVNAGSVGMPFGEPGAYWLVLDPGVRLVQTVYDFQKAAERVLSTKYPRAWDFSERNIIHPPAEDQMLKDFSTLEVGSE